MRVKVKTGFWEVREYNISVGDSGVRLCSDDTELEIPFCELVRFSLRGAAKCPDRFTIETPGASYDGRFEDAAQGKRFAQQLCERAGRQVEISLTTAQHGIFGDKT